jgi:hypothetical protein
VHRYAARTAWVRGTRRARRTGAPAAARAAPCSPARPRWRWRQTPRAAAADAAWCRPPCAPAPQRRMSRRNERRVRSGERAFQNMMLPRALSSGPGSLGPRDDSRGARRCASARQAGTGTPVARGVAARSSRRSSGRSPQRMARAAAPRGTAARRAESRCELRVTPVNAVAHSLGRRRAAQVSATRRRRARRYSALLALPLLSALTCLRIERQACRVTSPLRWLCVRRV